MIGGNGEQVGLVSRDEALQIAKDAGLDLVEISPNADPPVCRVMDYGKYLFEQSKRKTIQRKKQKQVQVKEVKFRPATDVGDYQVKVKKIIVFLERGDKVKISIRFRGREVMHRDLGLDLVERIKTDLPEELVIEQAAKLEGRQMSMVVALPVKIKKV